MRDYYAVTATITQTKAEKRAEIQQHVERFLSKNEITQVPTGVSGDRKGGLNLMAMVAMDKAEGRTRVKAGGA